MPASITRAARRLARRAAAAPTVAHERLAVGQAPAVGALLWRADRDLVGLRVHRVELRAAEVEEVLQRRFGLTAAQARLALLIAGGSSYAAAARTTGVAEGTVAARCTAVYAKLGVRGRTGLAALVADLAAPADLRGDG